MRLALFTVPLGIALSLGGLAMYLNAKPKTTPDVGLDFEQPKHPVTTQMTLDAAKMARAKSPEFNGKAVRGEVVKLGGEQEQPQFVLFILDTCPCSVDAQPLFNNFSKHWKGKVDFIGVINVEGRKAREWTSDYRPVFPVVADAKKTLISAFHAKQSVYSALISKEGQIVKLWPGYSLDLFKDMNETIAKELDEKPVVFDAQYAPKEKLSGCYF